MAREPLLTYNDAWAKPGWARQVEAVPRLPSRFGHEEAVVGCGQWQRHDVRPVVEDHLGLDVRVLRRAGGLTPGSRCSTAWKVGDQDLGVADICVGEAVIDVRAVNSLSNSATGSIELDRTPCRYRGSRTWLICPGCGSRRTVLYLSPAEGFKCRACLDLAYAMSRLSKENRRFARMHRLADQVGVDLATGQWVGKKGMHASTVERLIRQYTAAVSDLSGSAPPWLYDPVAPPAGPRHSERVA